MGVMSFVFGFYGVLGWVLGLYEGCGGDYIFLLISGFGVFWGLFSFRGFLFTLGFLGFVFFGVGIFL